MILFYPADFAWFPCSKCSKNLINQQITIFYIENISQNFPQLRKKVYFWRVRKKNSLNVNVFSHIIRNPTKTTISIMGNRWFPLQISWQIFFEKSFSELKKYNIFSELRKNLGYIFDVKNCVLLIYDVFRTFGARKPCGIRRIKKGFKY